MTDETELLPTSISSRVFRRVPRNATPALRVNRNWAPDPVSCICLLPFEPSGGQAVPGNRRKNPAVEPKYCHDNAGSRSKLFWNNGSKCELHCKAALTSSSFNEIPLGTRIELRLRLTGSRSKRRMNLNAEADRHAQLAPTLKSELGTVSCGFTEHFLYD
uniref:Uncharacterized protein n=1 Tax=Glossina pallidipes TaxID=7398 RepID=A0A1A9ZTG5_GLOPL